MALVARIEKHVILFIGHHKKINIHIKHMTNDDETESNWNYNFSIERIWYPILLFYLFPGM